MIKDFEIRNRALEMISKLSESFGEITEEDEAELEAILQGVDDPMAHLFYMQKHAEAQIAECKELEAIYYARRKHWQNSKESYRVRMFGLLNNLKDLGQDTKVKGHWGTASIRKSEETIVTDMSLLSEEFIEVTRKAKKSDLKKHLKTFEGKAIPGAHIETNYNLSIRSK